MNMEDALEHFDYNIRGSSQGDSYPMFLDVELNPKSKNGEYILGVIDPRSAVARIINDYQWYWNSASD